MTNPIGAWRDIATGVNPEWATPEWADAAIDDPGDPGAPINTRLEGPWRVPWWDAHEDPYAVTGLFQSPDVQYPNETVGAKPVVGAYEPAFQTLGPVGAWGHEVSGGYGGDQAIGRIMRFPANIPDRFSPNGVWNTDYRDELAAVIAANGQGQVSDAELTTSLLLYPNT